MRYKTPIQAINNIFIVLCAAVIFIFNGKVTITDFSWLPAVASLSLLIMADMLLFSYLKTRNILSVRSIFLFLSFLFHMGYTWIFLFNPSFGFTGLDFTKMFNPITLYNSYIFSLLAIIGVYVGIQLGDRKPRIKLRRKDTTNLAIRLRIETLSRPWREKSYRNLGIATLLLSLPLRIYIDISRMSIGATQGYLQAVNFNINGYLSLLADFSVIGVVLLMIYYRNSTIKATLVLIASSSYCLFSISSGSRGGAIVNIIVLLFVFNSIVYRFKKGAFLLIACTALLIGLYITNIGLTRVDNSPEISGGKETASRFLQEFGGTQLTVVLVQQDINQAPETDYMAGYVSSLATVLPNLGGEVGKYLKANNFVLRLNYPAIGGSYIAELYYNLRVYGIIIAALIGFFLSKFEDLLGRYSKEHRYAIFAFSALMFKQLLWWIRDTSEVFPRYLIFGYIIFITLVILLRKFGFVRLTDHTTKDKLS